MLHRCGLSALLLQVLCVYSTSKLLSTNRDRPHFLVDPSFPVVSTEISICEIDSVVRADQNMPRSKLAEVANICEVSARSCCTIRPRFVVLQTRGYGATCMCLRHSWHQVEQRTFDDDEDVRAVVRGQVRSHIFHQPGS